MVLLMLCPVITNHDGYLFVLCSIGQNLARLELQVVLATFLSRFNFSPGPELERELKLAAATGQPPVSALHALAGAFITLQPMSGHMMLRISSRV
jgi:hypothetical protein